MSQRALLVTDRREIWVQPHLRTMICKRTPNVKRFKRNPSSAEIESSEKINKNITVTS